MTFYGACLALRSGVNNKHTDTHTLSLTHTHTMAVLICQLALTAQVTSVVYVTERRLQTVGVSTSQTLSSFLPVVERLKKKHLQQIKRQIRLLYNMPLSLLLHYCFNVKSLNDEKSVS